jgi:hypothetical protein
MALEKFRASPLPIPGAEYDQQYMLQLIRVIGLYFSQLDSLTPNQAESYRADQFIGSQFRGADFVGGFFKGYGNGIELPHAMLMSNLDQGNASITGENIVTYDFPVIQDGVYVEENSRIKFSVPGQYLINARFQFSNRSNSVAEIEIWAKNTGVNYPLSNSRFDIPARKTASINSHIVPVINGIFSVTDVDTDYLQLAWWSNNINVFLEHYAAGTTPTRPEIASVILTATFVSALPKSFFTPIPALLKLVGAAPSLLRGRVAIPPQAPLVLTGAAPTVTIA